MADSLSDILSGLQNGVVAINNLSEQITNTFSTANWTGTVTSLTASSSSGIILIPNPTTTVGSFSLTQFTSAQFGGVPASGGGTANFLRADGTWSAIVSSAGGTVTAIGQGTGIELSVNPIVSTGNISLAKIGQNTVLGNVAAGSTYPTALSTTQLRTLIGVFSSAQTGLVAASSASTTLFLRSDNTWVAGTGAGDVTGPSSDKRGGSVIWSSFTGKVIADGGGAVNVLAYRPVVLTSTSTASSSQAIQDAWTANKLIYLPTGNYYVASTLVGSTQDGAGIIGDGPYNSIIISCAATGNVITSAAGIKQPIFIGIGITRSLTSADVTAITSATLPDCPTPFYPASSGAGLAIGTQSNYCIIRDVNLAFHYNGLFLTGTPWSHVFSVTCLTNRNAGIMMDSEGSVNNGLQWQLTDVLAQCNGGHGFYVKGLPGGTTVANSATTGQFKNLATFKNGGSGIYFDGVWGIRISDCFFGSDVSDEVSIVSGGDPNYGNYLTSIYTEGSATGYGFNITTSASPTFLSNCDATSHALSGVINNGGNLVSISGGMFSNNGQVATPGNTYGILANSSGPTVITGAYSPSGGAPQTIGIVALAACQFLGVVTSRCSAISNAASTGYVVGNFA